MEYIDVSRCATEMLVRDWKRVAPFYSKKLDAQLVAVDHADIQGLCAE